MLVSILDKFLIFVSAAFDLGARELLFVGYTLFALLSKMSLFLITKSDKNAILFKKWLLKIGEFRRKMWNCENCDFVTKLCDRDNHKKLLPFEKIQFLLIHILVHIHILVCPWKKMVNFDFFLKFLKFSSQGSQIFSSIFDPFYFIRWVKFNVDGHLSKWTVKFNGHIER